MASQRKTLMNAHQLNGKSHQQVIPSEYQLETFSRGPAVQAIHHDQTKHISHIKSTICTFK